MNTKNFSKIIVLTIIRIIELAVMYYSIVWIYGAFPQITREAVIFFFIAAYCIYLGVTLADDYYEIKHGEGEAFMPWM